MKPHRPKPGDPLITGHHFARVIDQPGMLQCRRCTCRVQSFPEEVETLVGEPGRISLPGEVLQGPLICTGVA